MNKFFRLPTITSNTIAFVGLCLIIYEAGFHDGPERLGLIGLYATMIGLPLIVKADDVRRKIISTVLEGDKNKEALNEE